MRIIRNVLYLSIEFGVVCVQSYSGRNSSGISFTYIKNKMGPKIVAWGTRDFMECRLYQKYFLSYVNLYIKYIKYFAL